MVKPLKTEQSDFWFLVRQSRLGRAPTQRVPRILGWLPGAGVPRELVGAEHVALLNEHLRRPHEAHPHPNRTLHHDTVLTALLLSFFNSTQQLLRIVPDLTPGP